MNQINHFLFRKVLKNDIDVKENETNLCLNTLLNPRILKIT